MADHCPACGAEVRVAGRTTFYEVAEAENTRLREALDRIAAELDPDCGTRWKGKDCTPCDLADIAREALARSTGGTDR